MSPLELVNLLPEYLASDTTDEEVKNIALTVLADQIRELKLSIGKVIVQAKIAQQLENLDGSSKSLHQAKQLKETLLYITAEYNRLLNPNGANANS